MPTGSPVAVIDVGSNTTRLLVAERVGNGLRQLLSQRDFTRLGRGQKADGSIGRKKIEELVTVIERQLRLAKVMGAGEVHAVATAATRDAANRDQLVERVLDETGVRIDVLDEHTEARLAFLGATHALPQDLSGTLAVIDVGGGSTEVAVGTVEGGVSWSTSFRIGSALLPGVEIENDPPSVSDLDDVRSAVAAVFAGFRFPEVDHAIAIGGSASSLRRLVGNVLEHETLERAIRLITGSPALVVADQFGLDGERVEVLPAGVIILETVSDRIDRPLRIGKGGVREGKLLELLA